MPKLIRYCLGFAVLFILCGCTTPNSSESVLKEFPVLRPADGGKSPFTWKKFDGDDFLVFYGDLITDPSAGVGIYQGGDPRFKVPKNVTTIPGKLGVFDVKWYPLTDKDSPFYRTCLIDYQKAVIPRGNRSVTYVTKRHVWAYAATEEGLNAVIAALDKLTMFAARPSDITE